jgi:hypothetical protein
LIEPLFVSEQFGSQSVAPVGGYLNVSAGSHMSPEECRRNGAECLRLAQLVTNPADKMLLLHLADAWRRLAERAEFQSADQDDRPPPMAREIACGKRPVIKKTGIPPWYSTSGRH